MVRASLQRGRPAGLGGFLWTATQLFGSRLFGQVAGFVTTVVAARTLGPAAFGPYAFAQIVALLVSQIPGAGLDMSAVRISARHWHAAPERGRGVLALAGVAKLTIGLALAAGVAAAAGPLAGLGALQPEFVTPLRYAAAAGLALALSEYVAAVLQAQERFGLLLVVNMSVALIKLAPVLALAAAGALTLSSGLNAFLAASVAGAAVGLVVARLSWRGATRWDRATAREIWDFSAWFTLAVLLGTVANSLDTLMLARLAGPDAVGIYSSARSLALPVAIAGGAAATVLLPRLGRMAGAAPIGPAVWRASAQVAIGATLVCAGLVLAAPLALPLVFGAGYAGAVPVFQLLVLAYGLQAVTWPLQTALMVLDRPDLIARLNLLFLLVVLAGYAALVGRFGPVGAAGTLLAAYLLMLTPFALAARRQLRARDAATSGG